MAEYTRIFEQASKQASKQETKQARKHKSVLFCWVINYI